MFTTTLNTSKNITLQTWHDLKAETKKKKSKINSSMRTTGGGTGTTETLNTIDEAIIESIGEVPNRT